MKKAILNHLNHCQDLVPRSCFEEFKTKTRRSEDTDKVHHRNSGNHMFMRSQGRASSGPHLPPLSPTCHPSCKTHFHNKTVAALSQRLIEFWTTRFTNDCRCHKLLIQLKMLFGEMSWLLKEQSAASRILFELSSINDHLYETYTLPKPLTCNTHLTVASTWTDGNKRTIRENKVHNEVSGIISHSASLTRDC